jgi:excisionase family DNA binding protein
VRPVCALSTAATACTCALVDRISAANEYRSDVGDDARARHDGIISVNLDALAQAVAARLEPQETWLTVKEVAEHLRISQRQVRRLAGVEFPVYRPDGGKMLFNRTELDEWCVGAERASAGVPCLGSRPSNYSARVSRRRALDLNW